VGTYGKGFFFLSLPFHSGINRTKKRTSGGIMRYSKGDVVEFKVESNEKHTGQVRFIEEDYNENILYVDSFIGWAYKVPEKRIMSRVSVNNPVTYSGRKRLA
jgi:hypothetical protein